MKQIETLIEDIQTILSPRVSHSFDEENVQAFGQRLASHIRTRLAESRGRPTLRLSNIGTKCWRKLWYLINEPERAEQLPPSAYLKFLFGDILEELLLFLAKEAGHTVEGCQDEIEIGGVKGHRDAIIDGRIVDCKSASSFSFKKFSSNKLREDDPFGYLDQLGSYLEASLEDPRLTDKDVASFLVVDKTLGHLCLDTYPKSDIDYESKINDLKNILSLPEPPPRAYEQVPEGKSGNKKLGVNCSYCEFKFHCWPNLRVFNYSSGPMFLTEVVKEPKVMEIKEWLDV